MAYWHEEPEREDGDGREETFSDAVNARKWLRRAADNSHDPYTRDLVGDLRWIEQMAEPFFLGLDYDEDCDDVDEVGPF